MHFETRETSTPYMYVFAEPMEEDEIEEIQKGNRNSDKDFMEKVKRKLEEARQAKELVSKIKPRVLGKTEQDPTYYKQVGDVEQTEDTSEVAIGLEDGSSKDLELEDGVATNPLDEDVAANPLDEDVAASQELETDNAPEEVVAEGVSVDQELEADVSNDMDLSAAADAIEASIKANEINADIEGDQEMDLEALKAMAEKESRREVMGMTVMAKNFVDGNSVLRPDFLDETDKWTVDYSISEFSADRAWSVYNAMITRKQKHHVNRGPTGEAEEVGGYVRYIRGLARKGREWESEMAQKDAAREKIVFETRTQK